jgi:hypothetical protein
LASPRWRTTDGTIEEDVGILMPIGVRRAAATCARGAAERVRAKVDILAFRIV